MKLISIVKSINKLNKRKFSELNIIKNHSKQFLQDYSNFEFSSEENISKTVNFLKEKFFTNQNIVSLKNRNPYIFENNIKKSEMQVSELYQILNNDYNLNDKQIKFLILTNPNCFNYSSESFQEKKKFFSENFSFEEKDINYIMKNCPKLFFLQNTDLILKKKVLEYFFDNEKNLEELLKLHPYILITESDRLKKNLYKISEQGFSSENFFKIIKMYPLFLYRKPENILLICNFLKKKGMTKKELISLCTKNPFIFSMDFSKIFSPKIQIFESKGIKNNLLIDILIKYPFLITKGRNSILTKFRYLEKTTNKNILDEKFFPKILLYSYKNFIKPRGELMYKKKIFHWYDCLKMNDEQFCQAYGFDIQDLRDLKSSEFHEKEFDYVRIGYLKFLSKEVNERFYDYPLL